MSARVSPTERIRADIDALFTGDRDLTEVLEDVACLGARLIIQTAWKPKSKSSSAVLVTSAPPTPSTHPRPSNPPPPPCTPRTQKLSEPSPNMLNETEPTVRRFTPDLGRHQG